MPSFIAEEVGTFAAATCQIQCDTLMGFLGPGTDVLKATLGIIGKCHTKGECYQELNVVSSLTTGYSMQ
jgi:hypothetical protein